VVEVSQIEPGKIAQALADEGLVSNQDGFLAGRFS
jgi:hypothetical protein